MGPHERPVGTLPHHDGLAQPGTGRDPAAILATDLHDADKLELVTTDATDGTVSLFVNDGSANFSAIARVVIEGEPSALTEIGDRIAVADRLNSRVVLLRKLGDGRLTIDTTAPTGAEPIAIGAANFDADGRPDLITANDVGESVSVLLASGSGFEAPRTFSLPMRMNAACSTPPKVASTRARRTGSSISNITVATSSLPCGISGL